MGFFWGLVFGALAGAGAALLLTPWRGEQVRKQLAERGAGVTSQASTLASQARQMAEERGKAYDEQAGERVREAVEEARQTAEPLREETPGGPEVSGTGRGEQTPH